MPRSAAVVAAILLTASCSQEGSAPDAAPSSGAVRSPKVGTPGASPVMVGGEPQLDACATSGVVSRLDPEGDNFLAVRAGPGISFEETDRVSAGQPVTVCESEREWLGVVYGPTAEIDCGVASPQKRRAEYAGPCRSGWVSARFVTITAG